jgi:putative restriction endonuclease
VQKVERDPGREGHFYAYVTDYLDFPRAVPFKDGKFYYEKGLQREDGGTSKGAFGRNVRSITESEYDLIFKAGFAQTLDEANLDPSLGTGTAGGFAPGTATGFDEDATPFPRPIVELVVKRPFREAAFAASVKLAYANTCAMTGLQIINGGGRAEVQAAHIRPVAAGGVGLGAKRPRAVWGGSLDVRPWPRLGR